MNPKILDFVEIRSAACDQENVLRERRNQFIFESTIRNAEAALREKHDKAMQFIDSEGVLTSLNMSNSFTDALTRRGLPKGLSKIIGRLGVAVGAVTDVLVKDEEPLSFANDQAALMVAESAYLNRALSGYRDGYNGRPEVVDLTRKFAPSADEVFDHVALQRNRLKELSDVADNVRSALKDSLLSQGLPEKSVDRMLLVAESVAYMPSEESRRTALSATEIPTQPFVGVPTGRSIEFGDERFEVVRCVSDGKNVLIPSDTAPLPSLTNQELIFAPNTKGDYFVALPQENIPNAVVSEELSGPSEKLSALIEQKRLLANLDSGVSAASYRDARSVERGR